jgi:hypothetical protein
VEIAGFRSNTAPKLIDVADCFLDLGDIAERIRKELAHGTKCEERDIHVSQQPPPPPSFIEPEPVTQLCVPPEIAAPIEHAFHPPIGSISEANATERVDQCGPGGDFIRVTDDQ